MGKLNPEIKQLRKEKRYLESIITKQQSEILRLKDSIKNTRIFLGKTFIKPMLSRLGPSEQKIIEMRFGFEDGKTRTLEETGREFDVTRDRIRQVEVKALEKLNSMMFNYLK